MKEYNGSLNHRLKLNPIVMKAYITYKNQLSRCNNKKIKSYKDYGLKGIKVEYTARQFVLWYLEQFNSFNGSLKEVTVGRKNHSKNYSFDNIEMQTKSENSKESSNRCSHKYSIKVIIYKDGKFFKKCKSIKNAADITGYYFSYVYRCVNNIIKKQHRSFIFIKE